MRVAIMQPYFLPYIGYFQLMAAVDRFIVLDDVNFIKRGWINRNRLPSGAGTIWMTLPLVNASQNRLICEIDVMPDDGWKRRLERTVSATYGKAYRFADILPYFQRWLTCASGNLSDLLNLCLIDVASYMGVKTSFVPTSSVYPKEERKGQERILDICVREGASAYVNPPGGRELYDPELFARAGVELLFLEPDIKSLSVEHSGTEGPVLSILDLLMQNSVDALHNAVQSSKVVRP